MVNVPCYSMGTAQRSKLLWKSKILFILVRDVRTTSKETPGPGQYTKVALIHKMKAPTWV